MQDIKYQAEEELNNLLPFLTVRIDSSIMDSVVLRGTKEPKEQWVNGIFHNATHFIASVSASKGKRYYDGGMVSIEVISSHGIPKFRKYTGSPDKAIAKLKTWILSWSTT